MHNRPPLLSYQTNKLTTVTNWMLIGRNIKHSPAQGSNLFLGNVCRILVDNKIKLYLVSINMAVIIHHYGFNTATNHLTDNLGYANWLLLTTLTRFFSLKTCSAITHTGTAPFILHKTAIIPNNQVQAFLPK